MKILLFWVPMGLPCQRQDSILQEIKSINKDFEIEYITPFTSADKQIYYDNQITACPAMILYKEGKEIHKFRQGMIHDKENILKEMN